MISNKALRFSFQLQSIAKNVWGLNSDSVKLIYKGAILPFLTYCCSIWEDGLKVKRNFKKLQRVQRLIAIKICRAYRTVSLDAILVLAGILPIELKINES